MSTPISDHVHVTINVDSLSIEQANFGIPLLAAYHTVFPERVRTYNGNTGLSGLLSDGFTTASAVYKMAAALLAASPKVETFKVGRLANVHTQDVELEMTSAVEDQVVTVDIVDELGVSHPISYTIGAAETTTTVATAVAALINGALTNATATPTAENIQVVADNPGDVFFYSNNANCNLTDETPDPGGGGIAADLAAIDLADSTWYGVILDVSSAAIIAATAGYVETLRRQYFAQTQDSEVPTSGSGDIATTLQNAARLRSPIIYHHGPNASLAEYPAAGWVGKTFPLDPGSQTFAFKTLSGVTPGTMTPDQLTNLKAKNCNMYLRIAGVNITRYGNAPDGSWIDVTRFTDWLQARIEEVLFTLMAGLPKLPYDDDGVDLIRGGIFGVYSEGADNGGAELSDFTFSAPLAAAQTPADRTARKMRDIQFGGRLTSAIQEIYVTGNIIQ
jgi:hypothetical protein